MYSQYDVVALGELLVDFTDNGKSEQGNSIFEANPGGAPCNVLSMLQKLGNKTAFIGKVGEDFLGEMLVSKAAEQGIDMSAVLKDKNVGTTLAFVQKLPNGDRDFAFFRNPGADMMITADEVLERASYIKKSDIFHFGTLSMTSTCGRAATEKAIEIAKESGCTVSFDPNYRAPLWNKIEDALEAIRYGMSVCDILKISDNEIELVTGKTDIDEGIAAIKDEFGIKLIFATMGADGSRAYLGDMIVAHDGFITPDTIETTGAGDTFCASALHFVHKYGMDSLDQDKLKEILKFANAAASLITTRHGALAVMPSFDEVHKYILTASC
ncbi:carbohydrate kinase family protein [Butyrivibrio sp. AC2005]|uniref:carbohydrate kinase family protein n=1 Tax=Butyrivibrio sp. AC2005 TaxID=1280672 RepID=UPI00041F5881|nr:carbohydrate kinase [Butyrivibrio sp. AC2005]